MSSNENEELDKNVKTGQYKLFVREKLLPFLYKQFMTISIVVFVAVGFILPEPGNWVGSFKGSSYICVIVVFLHSGLKLKTDALKSAIKQWKAFLFGITSILLISTLIGTKLSQLLPFGESVGTENNANHTSRESIVGPHEFLLGLKFYYISPSAIATGVVLVCEKS